MDKQEAIKAVNDLLMLEETLSLYIESELPELTKYDIERIINIAEIIPEIRAYCEISLDEDVISKLDNDNELIFYEIPLHYNICSKVAHSIECIVRNIHSLFNDIESVEDDTQKSNNDKATGDFKLPSGLDTERARKYFAKAIEAQYIKVTDNGLQWMFGGERGNKVRLGYFIQKVFCPNNTETIPEKAINTLFGVDRIGSAISQIANAKKPQKWRAEIDNLFE